MESMIEYADPKKSPPRGSWRRATMAWIATNVGWMMIAILTIGLLSTVLAFATLPPVGVVSGIVLLLLLAIAGRGAQSARRKRAIAILAYVEQAVRIGAPLPDFLSAAARGERRAVRTRLSNVAAGLE